MNATSKDKINRSNNVRSSSAKSDRDPRVPSKLTKRELEDLYFSLMDTNMDLKRTVNMQQETVKQLNTKVHRLLQAQKGASKETNCCPQNKAVLSEQKDIIFDLKKANERMSERIRILNTRLCTTKQFLRCTPSLNTTKYHKACLASPYSESSVTMLHAKKSNAKNTIPNEKEAEPVAKSAETETNEQDIDPESVCKENKCRTIIEELKQKIIDMQEESSNHHSECSSRIARLEADVASLRAEGGRVRGERAAAQHALLQRALRDRALAERLRAGDVHCNEINSQLLMEKNKVAELETRLKASDMSNQAAKAIEARQSLAECTPEAVPRNYDTNGKNMKSRISTQSEGLPRNPRNSVNMDREFEKRLSIATTDGAPQESLPKNGDTMREEVDKRLSITIDPPETLPKNGDAIPKEVEKQLSITSDEPNNGTRRESNQEVEATDAMDTSRAQRLSIHVIDEPMNTDTIISPQFLFTPFVTDFEETSKSEEIASTDVQQSPHGSHNPDVDGGTGGAPGTLTSSPAANATSPEKSKSSDDSGYNDNRRNDDDKVLEKINTDLVKRITELQDQVDKLRITSSNNKYELSSKIPVTKPSTQKRMSDDNTVDSNSSRDVKNVALEIKEYNKSSESERKKELYPEKGTKDLESTESAAIHRANQIWNKYAGNGLQHEERIQFSNSKKNGSGVNDSSTHAQTLDQIQDEPITKHAGKTPKRRRDESKSIDDRYIAETNELVDQLVDDTNSEEVRKTDDSKSRHPYQDDLSRPASRNDFLQDSNLLDSKYDIGIDYKKPEMNTRRENEMSTRDGMTFGTKRSSEQMHDIDKIPLRESTNQLHEAKGLEQKVSSHLEFATQTQCIRISDDDGIIQSIHSPTGAQIMAPQRCGQTQAAGTDSEQNQSPPIRQKQRERRASAASADVTRDTGSPDNTDREISHMSDLPHEQDGKSPRNVMSPGEHRTSTSYTDTYTEPTGDLPTISEGELITSGRRRSLGETKDEAVEVRTEAATLSQKMEQALLSISLELAWCRELLQGRRASETRDASTSSSWRMPLKRSSATPALAGPAAAPAHATFTLHIGTLVLSDEAVVYSRDQSLLLTWKFYDQNLAMTRMRGGRVILFDFTTEYESVMDQRFTDYLKFEDMPIIICELNKQNCPFAICTLPLGDLLLHPNRRVDMSLALTVGPDMRRGPRTRSMDSLVTSDEVGVLDLWCMLQIHAAGEQQSHPCQDRSALNESSSEEYRMTEQPYRDGRPAAPGAAPPIAIIPSQLLDDGSLAKYSVIDNRKTSCIENEVTTSIRCSTEMKNALDMKRLAEINDSPPIKEKREEDVLSGQPQQSMSSWAKFIRGQYKSQKKNKKGRKTSYEVLRDATTALIKTSKSSGLVLSEIDEVDPNDDKASQLKKSVTIMPKYSELGWEQPKQDNDKYLQMQKECIEITIQWLALNEECAAMSDPNVQRLYVAYSLLGRSGAEFETPVSLPKPRSYVDKCAFNYKKSVQLRQCDMALLGHMGRCTSNELRVHDPKNCIVFTVISEPAEDPLGLATCEDVGYAYLYLGDVLSCTDGEAYVEVVAVHAARGGAVCGVLAVQLDGLGVVRRASY